MRHEPDELQFGIDEIVHSSLCEQCEAASTSWHDNYLSFIFGLNIMSPKSPKIAPTQGGLPYTYPSPDVNRDRCAATGNG